MRWASVVVRQYHWTGENHVAYDVHRESPYQVLEQRVAMYKGPVRRWFDQYCIGLLFVIAGTVGITLGIAQDRSWLVLGVIFALCALEFFANNVPKTPEDEATEMERRWEREASYQERQRGRTENGEDADKAKAREREARVRAEEAYRQEQADQQEAEATRKKEESYRRGVEEANWREEEARREEAKEVAQSTNRTATTIICISYVIAAIAIVWIVSWLSEVSRR